ncbi:Zn-ribbon domain-containing OB-fold protein [Streptomyces sp. NPDC056227]|uniref:Zn-ribbon domain-containing OB-fold protein n=1 Tax=Streptomyces sp. NPDC056227 TaxID=3345753 RepID=UPI0035DBEC2F
MTTTQPAPTTDGPKFYEQTWDLSYKHALGETTSKFLGALTEGKILGRRCPSCERVLVPAKSFCDRDHTSTTDWVEVANIGAIEMFTIVYEPFRNLPAPPYALAYVTLDGADTALVGYVRGIDLSDKERAIEALAIGTRVAVKFADEPTGTAADYWFELPDRQD